MPADLVQIGLKPADPKLPLTVNSDSKRAVPFKSQWRIGHAFKSEIWINGVLKFDREEFVFAEQVKAYTVSLSGKVKRIELTDGTLLLGKNEVILIEHK